MPYEREVGVREKESVRDWEVGVGGKNERNRDRGAVEEGRGTAQIRKVM
jgi:hypothetical protein